MEILFSMVCQNLPSGIFKKSKIQPLNRSHALASLTVYHTSAATSALAAYRRKHNFQNVAPPPPLLSFRAMHGTAPQYLSDLLHKHTPPRILRSSSGTLLSVLRPRPELYGSRAFSVAAPLLWNELSNYIISEQTLTSFKTKLKTHLFSETNPQRQ